ncbi:MAG: glycosyltransferase, partial [Planctomycetes bacterium]|nr:glycosyltransferase [Planctomycetota bacterium]
MRIAFDFNPVVLNKFSGFYSFGTGLLKGFSSLSDRPEFLLFHSRRFHRQSQEAMAMFSDTGELKPTSIKMRWLENFWKYSNYPKLESLVGDFDIYHSLHHLMPPTRGKPRILTVHDLRRYKLPQFYKKSKLNRFEEAVKRADHFIAVSNSTKNDLCEFFGIPQEKINVVHLAADSGF